MNQIPNDGFPVAALPAGQAPDPDFEASVCLKGKNGKCGHLWQITTSFEAGNPEGTFIKGKEPKKTYRVCLRSASNEMPLNGLVVFTCNEHTDLELREDPAPFVIPDNLPPLVPPPAVMPTVCNAAPATAAPAVARVARPPVGELDLSKLPIVKMNKDNQ